MFRVDFFFILESFVIRMKETTKINKALLKQIYLNTKPK